LKYWLVEGADDEGFCLVSWTHGTKFTYTEGDNGIVNSKVVKININRGSDYGGVAKY
jgi:hypothetical protein